MDLSSAFRCVIVAAVIQKNSEKPTREGKMFGSGILDIAIGVIFIYVLLSLICSTLNEWMSRMFSFRSRTLKKAVEKLLVSSENTEKFYDHPLIKVLSRPGWFDRLLKRESSPSYIPSHLFALAMLDTLQVSCSKKGLKSVAKIPDQGLKSSLLLLLEDAGQDMKTWVKNIEDWFNAVMDRVSGWYRKKVQLIILALAFVVSAFLNADTFMIANGISRDATIRAAFVAAAEEASRKPLSEVLESASNALGEYKNELKNSPIPFGWSKNEGDIRKWPEDFAGWLMKAAGLLLTTIAVSLGAPFWFDLLARFINIRQTGERPEKSSPEPGR